MLANALPVGFSAEELGSGILQPGLESFSQTGVFPVLRELVFLKDICKRLRDSILSPIFHSYIFAMYKNESLWI